MRLVALSVRHFQCIESADLELGPGLNVLFGPNDLGKSSLAWAIRAVLLLQHGSAEHERFVSWYGGGEPTVVLTLQDDTERYWRIRKCFARGSTGRASLESSKDGREYRGEASGRQADDKLREILRWGIQRPGGRGGPQGLPQSFLTHVLLSEQDDVRKILFEASLADDPDESGRARLREALGALAQDPVFKRVLDTAQAQVDRAFTPTGRRKRSADSPFIAIADRIKELRREKEELDQRLKDSAAAEERLRRLVSERDELHHRVLETRDALATAERQLATCRQRDELRARLAAHEASLAGAEALARRVEKMQEQIAELDEDIQSAGAILNDARQDFTAADSELERARARADALTRDDPDHAARRHSLEEAEKDAIERLHASDRERDRWEAALRAATAVARDVKEFVRAVASFEQEERAAASRLEPSRAQEERARAALEDARERLRDLSSSDRAQAEALRRQELENRRLKRVADLAEHERAVKRARALDDLVRRAADARAAVRAQAQIVEASGSRVEELGVRRVDIENELATLDRLSLYAQLSELRRRAEARAKAAAEAEELRTTAACELDQAAAARAGVPAGIPDHAEIEAMRRLAEEVRVAEARLGAVSAVIRPRRPLPLHVARDGVADDPRVVAEPIALSAGRELLIEIEDLVAIEVAGGDPATRDAAEELRARWQREGAPRLAGLGVGRLDDVLALRQQADDAEKLASEHEHSAERAEERAHQIEEGQPPIDMDRLTALEAALAEERELAPRLAALGADPAAEILRLRTEAEDRKRSCEVDLGHEREARARAEAQLEALERDAATLEAEASATPPIDGRNWSELVTEHEAAAAIVRRDLAAIEDSLAEVAATGPAVEVAARDAVARCEQALAAALAQVDEDRQHDQKVREALAGAVARRDAACAQAREIDTESLWARELSEGAGELSLEPWRARVERAREGREDAGRRLAEVRRRLVALDAERTEAMTGARRAVEHAEAAVRSARRNLEQLQETDRADRDDLARRREELASARVELAQTNLAQARDEAARVREQLSSLGQVVEMSEAEVERRRSAADRLALDLGDKEKELHMASGALEQVGGAVVAERAQEVERALEQAQRDEHLVETEFEAWRVLAETLRAAESSESSHLGRSLAGPVSERFRQLTGERYGAIELGVNLEAEGLLAAGEIREIAALSAGTQDQLATLLRLCIAEQLRSSIILDDHLSQSDPARVAWFRDKLLGAARSLQILCITCRPLELLARDELPDGVASRSAAGGLVRAIDLTRIIRRFAPGDPRPARTSNDHTSSDLTST